VSNTEKETDTVKIMFLHPNQPSQSCTYPTRTDILQVPRQDVLMKVDLCITTGRNYTLSAEENDNIKST
jgi:hypothetical protein